MLHHTISCYTVWYFAHAMLHHITFCYIVLRLIKYSIVTYKPLLRCIMLHLVLLRAVSCCISFCSVALCFILLSGMSYKLRYSVVSYFVCHSPLYHVSLCYTTLCGRISDSLYDIMSNHTLFICFVPPCITLQCVLLHCITLLYIKTFVIIVYGIALYTEYYFKLYCAVLH